MTIFANGSHILDAKITEITAQDFWKLLKYFKDAFHCVYETMNIKMVKIKSHII